MICSLQSVYIRRYCTDNRTRSRQTITTQPNLATRFQNTTQHAFHPLRRQRKDWSTRRVRTALTGPHSDRPCAYLNQPHPSKRSDHSHWLTAVQRRHTPSSSCNTIHKSIGRDRDVEHRPQIRQSVRGTGLTSPLPSRLMCEYLRSPGPSRHSTHCDNVDSGCRRLVE